MKGYITQNEAYEFGNGWGLFIDIENTKNISYTKKQNIYLGCNSCMNIDFYTINVYDEIEKDTKHIKNKNIFNKFKKVILKYKCNPFYSINVNVCFVAFLILALSIY